MVPHILIVEADSGAAQMTNAILARAVPAATVTIEAAIDRAQQSLQLQLPDALIIDPSLNYAESARLIQRLKAARPEARVIVIASAPTPSLRRQMDGLGVDAYLEKPALLPLLFQELLANLQPAQTDRPAADAVHNATAPPR